LPRCSRTGWASALCRPESIHTTLVHPDGRPIAYTPRHLAERILAEQAAMQARGAPDGERKQVTVLFADLKGSLELLADRDPEEARPLQAHCRLGLGNLYARLGRRDQARTALAGAPERYRTMEMTFWLPQAQAMLAQVEGR